MGFMANFLIPQMDAISAKTALLTQRQDPFSYKEKKIYVFLVFCLKPNILTVFCLKNGI